MAMTHRNTASVEHTHGILAFLIVAIAMAWVPLVLLQRAMSWEEASLSSKLLHASVLYALTMTVPPLVALVVVRRLFDRRPLDYGARPASARYQLLAVTGPLALAALAAATAALLLAPEGSDPATPAQGDPDWRQPLAFMGVICILWVQAIAEEIGWRGYVLPRLMQRLGPWRGLALHGALWGVWYAPLFLAASGAPGGSLARSGYFVVTCVLLGVLLGWLRIASRSLVASATANATLTLAAGLPLVLLGTDAARSAIYRPPGWIALCLAIALLFIARQHRAIRTFSDRDGG